MGLTTCVVHDGAKSFRQEHQHAAGLAVRRWTLVTAAVHHCVLIECLRMQPRPFFRWIFPAVLGLLAGFLALAWAITSESSLPVSLVCLFSPGLKIAELVMPAAKESLAWTFGWFLRIGIGVNGLFYFAIFALLAYLVDRRRSQTS